MTRVAVSPEWSRAGEQRRGSGDVKAGVVAGLMARGLSAEGAAAWAVALHQGAGRAVSEHEAPLGFLARDLLPWIPREMARLAAQTA
jgi:NAD(P)H-hydrate repair Nnr-like enzyme with NAD(P)H-hydrate dehydratase domain